jgi:hypothetical protein
MDDRPRACLRHQLNGGLTLVVNVVVFADTADRCATRLIAPNNGAASPFKDPSFATLCPKKPALC